ncbi:MAG: class I SAM-dependent methyltransferase [Actinobacteria bacterium]|nr:class I SAM-dependent methyltransferase [Actinomycetota bacterium]
MTVRKSDYESYDYREFWREDKRAYEDTSERIALRKLLGDIREGNKLFLDLGCGYGRLFDEYKSFRNILLVDYSVRNLRNAKQRIEEMLKSFQEKPSSSSPSPSPSPFSSSSIFFLSADATNLPLKPSCADVVLTVRVVHHLDNLDKYFDEVKRVLKDGGIFILEFANKRNLKNILRFFMRRMDGSPFSLFPLKVGETILNYHPDYVIGLLTSKGFGIDKRISVSNFRLEFLKKYLNLKTLLLFENWFQRLFSWTLLGPSIFLKCTLSKDFSEGCIKGRTSPKKALFSTEGKGFRRGLSITFEDILEDILQCPYCKKDEFFFRKDEIVCNGCKKSFLARNGILVFK